MTQDDQGHVRVTTVLGTSPAVPLGRFAYGGPAPVVVSAVTPRSGEAGTQQAAAVGSGFAAGATVRFKDVAATVDGVRLPSRITVTAPHRLLDDKGTFDVTVKVGAATSPTSPADEFTDTRRDRF